MNQCHCGAKQRDPLTVDGLCEACDESYNEARIEGPKLTDLPFADLYEACRTGYVQLKTWSGASYMVKVDPKRVRAEIKRLGVTMKDAREHWQTYRNRDE